MALSRKSLPVVVLCLTMLATSLWLFKDLLGSTSSNTSSVASLPSQTPSIDLQTNFDAHEADHDSTRDIQNRTLGVRKVFMNGAHKTDDEQFEKIYAISMPHRTDKRDYLALLGLVSDLDIAFVDGVNGNEIHADAIPAYWKGSNTVGEYGCWRAHMNIYQHMLQTRISSALILEDDADWDALLRPQLVSLARGLRLLQNATLPLRSPYGDNWDILTLGHNGLNNRIDIDQTYYATRNDPTVIAESRRTWGRKPNLSIPALGGNHTRVVMEVSKFTSTTAYALSLRGVARLLHDQALLPNARAIDMGISDFCNRNTYGTSCYSAYPMLFGRFRSIGPKSRDSDRRTSSNDAQKGSGGGQAKDDRLLPESEFTVFPVSLNLERLLKGETVIMANDQERDMMKSVDLKDFIIPDGEEVFVRKNEYVEV